MKSVGIGDPKCDHLHVAHSIALDVHALNVTEVFQTRVSMPAYFQEYRRYS
jgi:hypothetical protein